MRTWQITDCLRLVQSAYSGDTDPLAQIDDFDAIVPEGSHEEARLVSVDGEVIDAAANIGKPDGLHELERC